MTSKASLEVIQFLTYISGPVLCLIPLRFHGLKRVSSGPLSPSQQHHMRLWRWKMLTCLLIAALEFLWNLKSFKQRIPGVIFHVVILITKMSCTSYILTFQTNAETIRIILNSIPSTSLTTRRYNSRKPDKLLWVLLLFATTVPLGIFILMPVTSLLFHEHVRGFHMATFGPDIALSNCWKIFLLLLEMIIMFPCGFLAALAACVALTILHHIDFMSRDLITGLMRSKIVVSAAVNRFKIGIQYRKIQIFVLVCNQAFQWHVWAITQFAGASILIPALYSFVVLHGKFSPWFDALLLTFSCVSVTYVALILHVGGKPVKYSEKILELSMSFRVNCEWSTRFFRSCPVLALKIGEVHKIDRKRASNFFRFILQRTAFLVANTDQDWHDRPAS